MRANHMAGSPVVNALTFDVEEWFHGLEQRDSARARLASRLDRTLDVVLETLSEARVRATFFVLGCVAVSHPHLVRSLTDAGHEVGSHGWAHAPLPQMDRARFREELRCSIHQLEDVLGQPVTEHRAAYFSVTPRTPWVFDELVDAGIRYDSSVFPIRHYRCGIPGALRLPHRLAHDALVEFPISTVRIAGSNLPFSGGFYFRALPYPLIRACFARINRAGHPAIAYFHPWEFDPDPPRFHGGTRLNRLSYHQGLSTALPKLRALLLDFEWAPMGEVLGDS
jgi:polysaccharide deacetylase family protein (PEP-CTERM system associated)